MVMATARNQPDDLLVQYASEVNAEMERRGLSGSQDGALALSILRKMAAGGDAWLIENGMMVIDSGWVSMTDEEIDLARRLREQSGQY